MRCLSEAAENVSFNFNARHGLPEFARRADEVGQMATSFQNMTQSLYRRIEASERFAQDVAHELKNPLTAARSTAEAMAYAKTPAAQQELVRQIQEELKRLNKLITDVSNASRLDAELAFEETEPVDLLQVLDAVFQVFEDILSTDTRKVVMEVEEVPGNLDAFVVRGHEARLGRVLTNLIDNAISFSPELGVVKVVARRVGSEIELVVDDDGPGIPSDKLEDVFKRFYSDRPQTDRTGGKNSGLGLRISREIVQAYGGRIWAANRIVAPGAEAFTLDEQAELRDRRAAGVVGTRFTVRLPAADATPSRGAPPLARRS
jgi:two-component system sensor histidine kinase ChvG